MTTRRRHALFIAALFAIAIAIAIASGAGAESRQQIGMVIVGGLLVGTFFTLFVVPTLYMLLRRWRPIVVHQDEPQTA